MGINGDINQVEIEDSYGLEDAKCGIWGWKPNWLQVLASTKIFILVYGLLGMNESAFASYSSGIVTTLEKRFSLPSTYLGMLQSMWDLGTIFPFILISYIGGKHKMLWVSRCTIIAAIACFVMVLPQVIIGPGKAAEYANKTSLLCNENEEPENCSINNEGLIAFGLMGFSFFLIGIGTSAYFTLGAAYLDDNVSKNKFPFYFGFTVFVRLFGAPFGLYLASYYTSKYIDPNVEPPFDENDPRWIGAWHKGILELIITILLAFFPKILPREVERRKHDKERKTANENTREISLKDFKETTLRIIKNPVVVLNTISSAFFLFGSDGNSYFLPKYIETQFRQTTSVADKSSGLVILISSAVGVLVSGAIISKFKPSPRILIGWTVFSDIMQALGYFAFSFLGCYNNDLFGSYNVDGNGWNMTSSCNTGCECGLNTPYMPICSENGATTFYSPCHAGCEFSSIINNTQVYSNCSCIDNGIAFEGACVFEGCTQQLYIFLALHCIVQFFQCIGRTGNAVCQYRAVKPEDKSISLGISAFVFALFVHVPAPIVYGKILDSTCLVWGSICGSSGNCWLYNGENLRHILNHWLSTLLIFAAIADCGLFYYVKPLELYETDENQENTIEKRTENSLQT